MKTMNVIFVVLMLCMGMGAHAQESENNWFIQGQLGASYSLGNAGIGKLIAPAGQIAVASACGTDCSRQVFQSHARSPSGHQRLERKRGQREQPTRLRLLLRCRYGGRTAQPEHLVLREEPRTLLQHPTHCRCGLQSDVR